MVPEGLLRDLVDEVTALDADHRTVVGAVAKTKARAATVEAALHTIHGLTTRQTDLLTEAALAIRFGLYRSAFVSAFAAVADELTERIDRKGHLATIAAARRWKLTTVEDLQDQSDFNVAEAAKDATTISKAQMKSFHGLLHRRNQCAHPSGYTPTLDEALGYVSEVVRLIDAFSK